MNRKIKPLLASLLLAVTLPSIAHHSVLHYDGKVELRISGTVTAARFGFPHSVYRIDVENDQGNIEEWILSTEDPRDAERLGFVDEIRAIKRGDPITVVGWPHRFRDREIRGHQLHYPDGRVVMMRRGNYIWPKDILRLDRFVANPDTIGDALRAIDPALPTGERIAQWIAEGDHVARAAFEVSEGRPRLIGLTRNNQTDFLGVDELLVCHTQRDAFTVRVDVPGQTETVRSAIAAGSDYISEYNRVLSRWWEQERASCR